MTVPTCPPTRILLVDDDPAFRSALRMLLSFGGDLAVVGEVSGAQDAIDRCITSDIDVVLMDVQMRGMDGIAATRVITDGGAPPPAVIILTTFEVPELQARAAAAGAARCLLKRDSTEALLATIRDVAAARRRARLDHPAGA